jgi:Zn-dependent protease with chaperone function
MSTLQVHYFDGRSARAQAAQLSVQDHQLVVSVAGEPAAHVALRAVQWPERTRHGSRIAQLPAGASLQALEPAAWDAWVGEHIAADSWLVRMQQSWRGVAVACVLLVTALVGLYVWGLPVAARGVLTLVPQSVDQAIGDQVLTTLEGQELHPSQLPPAEQARIRAAFAAMVNRAYPQDPPVWRLEFRAGLGPVVRKSDQSADSAQSPPRRSALGANAFALLGGVMVVTDELVQLVNDDQVVLGVLGHEIGHVRYRHGMRQLIQITALGAIVSAAFGDYASLLATLPVVAGGMAYSRQAEREADEEAIRILQANGISPLVMVKLFAALRQEAESGDKGGRADTLLGIAFSSHPSDTQRIERFEQAAGQSIKRP